MGSLGIYDSGLGGITIYNEVRQRISGQSIYYFADTKALPLGDKSHNYIKKRVEKAVQFLFDKGCDLVILACNTASVVAVRHLQRQWLKQSGNTQRQVLGINIPILEYLDESFVRFKDGMGIVISTPRTDKTNFYKNRLRDLHFQSIQSVPIAGLAEAVDLQEFDRVENLIKQACSEIYNSVDFVLLACTHYPLAIKIFKKHIKAKIFIDPTAFIGFKLHDYIKRHPEYPLHKGSDRFWVSGNVKEFNSQMKSVFGLTIKAQSAHV